MKTELPKIIAMLGCKDHGPCDAGATAVCPHCGADGRYVYTFLCEDGSTRGAMSGCLKLFPRSAAALECEKALAKQTQNRASKWDQRVLAAIEALRTGALDLAGLERITQSVHQEKILWMRKKGYRR